MNAKPQVNQVSVIEHSSTALAVATPMSMLAQAVERGMAPETIDKLMALAERWDKTQARKAFDIAIARAKAEIPVIKKTATGHNNKYADLAAIARAVDPIIAKHGLSYRFRTVQEDKISVTCVLSHEAGHFEENTLVGMADKGPGRNDIQAIGSALTYLQRYSLVQALGLAATADDDGKASGAGKTIAADEMQNIRDIIAAIGDSTVEARLLRWLKVDKIEHIPLDRYDDAVENLKKVKRS